MTPLVSAAELAAHPAWRSFDCRHDLANPEAGVAAYAAGHIPGALFAHLDRDLSGAKSGRNGRHPLPTAERLGDWLSVCGIDAETTVVAYDAGNGMFAARLWWLLRWLGHDKVAVLDGGLAAWQAAGGALTAQVVTYSPRRFTPRPQALAVDVADVMAQMGAAQSLVVDARAADRFRGENETLDPVGGHIPGAVNRPFARNLGCDGRFKPAAELRAEFTALLGGRSPHDLIHQCGSGVTACHNLLAMEIAGLPGARLYPGSWSEWCADPARPVASGD